MMRDVDAGEETEEDDEETLQLKLAQIEARLKLKRLKKAREAREKSSQSSQTGETEAARPAGVTSSFDGAERVRRPEFARPRPRSMVEVPASPTRKHIEPAEQLSPARRLGIDKGIRAQDVSLKRASNYRGQNVNTTVTSLRQMEPPPPPPKVKSFSQRLAENRTKDKEREEKQARMERSRSTGFGLKNMEILRRESFSSARPSSSHSTATATSLQDPFGGKSRSFTMGDTRAPATPVGRPSSNLSSYSNSSRPQSSSSFTGRPVSQTAAKYAEISRRDSSSEATSFESFSSLHLKNRTIDHTKLTRVLDGKTIVTIPQLLKSVKAPEYDPPDMENDYVVLGVICYKSNPLTPKNGVKNNTVSNEDKNRDGNQAGKFMVIKLTDLKHEMDLFLFDTGFSQFWKLPIGTLVAVLNPDIMPPPQHQRDSGKFSLKLTSSDDTVLEIGTARDLDFCHARKKDGKDCGSWIDGRKTEYCDFHIELQLDKAKRGRMEVNSMSGTGFGRTKAGGSGGMFGFRAGTGRGGGSQEIKREGRYHDRFLHETMYIASGTGAAARLLDSDEQGFERGASREERHRKRLADQEKERELARRLGEIGGNAGSDYMRLKGGSSSLASSTSLPVRSLPADAAATRSTASPMDTMGLLNRKAEDVSLAPVKRKRVNTGPSRYTTTHTTSHGTSRSTSHISNSSAPVGWGGANRRGLLLSPKKNGRMERGQTTLPPLTTRLNLTRPAGLERTDSDRSARSEESGTGADRSPLKKKARLLVPDKGIREPGRDSLAHMDVGMLAAMDEDDDDDLEVI